MKGSKEFIEVYLYRDVIDFRKSIDGLAMIVADGMKRDAFSGALFVFCARTRDKIKALYWDKSGYALWYKRLEEEKFVWPRKSEEDVIPISGEKLGLLLEGINIWAMREHRALSYKNPG